MKLFNYIKEHYVKQKTIFFLFIGVLLIPNLFLFFTEPASLLARFCNIIIPLSIYWLLLSSSPKPGKIIWLLFPLLFLGAFQLVLLYLFEESIIAVDMFLNLSTTNSSEALELLGNLWPAIIGVLVLYVPTLFIGILSIMKKEKLSSVFLYHQRKFALYILGIGLIFIGITYFTDKSFRIKNDIYPANVGYNIALALQRNAFTRNYEKSSEGFLFYSLPEHINHKKKEIYVMVIGETSRAANWQLYGYNRNTNPKLSTVENLIHFSDVLTQSNTTHKSVPMLLSNASALHYDCIYQEKSIITAFKEAGFHTAFFSNQRPNHSFIDFFGKEADRHIFIKELVDDPDYNPSDNILLELLENEIRKGYQKLFIVLHTYGSHFNYQERYPLSAAYFLPDNISGAQIDNRQQMINAYDNTIRYTDNFLYQIIILLNQDDTHSAMIYASDHGEDIFDDKRKLFLHASPVPSYYQLHIPLILWMSNSYKESFPICYETANKNKDKAISSRNVFHTILSLGGIHTPYRNDSLSIVSPLFVETKRYYLNDHNQPKPFDDIGLKKEDFMMFKKAGIKY